MELYMMILFVVMLVMVCSFLGYLYGYWKVASQCEDDGYFTAFGTDYYTFIKIGPDGEIDALGYGPFAEGTLEKIKFLQSQKELSMSNFSSEDTAYFKNLLQEAVEKDRQRPFFALPDQIDNHDCVQCCRDAGVIQRRMILCVECGNKRCPKALNHRMQCTHSNNVDQVGIMEPDSTVYHQNVGGGSLI